MFKRVPLTGAIRNILRVVRRINILTSSCKMCLGFVGNYAMQSVKTDKPQCTVVNLFNTFKALQHKLGFQC